MLAGSVLLHLVLLGLILFFHPHGAPASAAAVADSDVSVVFQSAGEKQAATATPNPAPAASTALGNLEAKPTPTPSQSTAAPTPPPTPPPQPVAPAPAPTEAAPPTPPAPPQEVPQQEASLQPPQPQAPATPPTPAPPPPTPAPPTPQAATPPPMVSLDPSEEGETPVVPQQTVPPPPQPFQLSVPTPSRPPPPPRPRAFTQQVPRSRSGFPMPQNWSLATGPASLLSQHGVDRPEAPRGSQSDSEYKHLAGADPGEDWAAELHRWASDHAYYPREASDNGEEGEATIQATINRYGKVMSLQLVSGSGSTFLDAAWLSEWRNATVPRFPPGTPEDTTTLLYTIHYILVRGRR